jgi:hypothetical protein
MGEIKEKRPVGRPRGSGAGLSANERLRLNREKLAKAGGTRLDFTLDPESSVQLTGMIEKWQMKTRKEAVQYALSIVNQIINPKSKSEK